MAGGQPAITGKQLINLLVADGWKKGRRATHGIALHKNCGRNDIRTTTVQPKTDSMPKITLRLILGVKQTGLGRTGLQQLIKEHGLR